MAMAAADVTEVSTELVIVHHVSFILPFYARRSATQDLFVSVA